MTGRYTRQAADFKKKCETVALGISIGKRF